MITNGPSDRDMERTVPEGELARNAGIDVIVVGVGNSVNQTELSGIASRKHFHHHCGDICFLFRSSKTNVFAENPMSLLTTESKSHTK